MFPRFYRNPYGIVFRRRNFRVAFFPRGWHGSVKQSRVAAVSYGSMAIVQISWLYLCMTEFSVTLNEK